MSKTNLIPEYQTLSEFYLQQVLPYKNANPTDIRLDGRMSGASRNVSAYFWYLKKKWKVDGDTDIDRLKLAFEKVGSTDEPFKIKPTRDKKGVCLVIKDQPLRNKKFYVYRVSGK